MPDLTTSSFIDDFMGSADAEEALATLGTTAFDPTAPGPIGGTTPAAGSFTSLEVDDATFISDMTDTWNDSGTTFTALKMNVTDTASAVGSLLQDWQIGGVSQAKISKAGLGTFKGLTVNTNASDVSLISFGAGGSFGSQYGIFWVESPAGNGGMYFIGSGENVNGVSCFISGTNSATLRMLGGDASITLGRTHATTATDQTIKAHDVTTGTGAALTLKGGTGSVANGAVMLHGGNRAAYDASPSATTIRDILISHGLMAAS